MVIGDELGDKAEVGNLCSGPAKLEDDDEGPIVEEGGPLGRGCPTAQAGTEDEGEGEQDTGGACRWAEQGQVTSSDLSTVAQGSLGCAPVGGKQRHRKG